MIRKKKKEGGLEKGSGGGGENSPISPPLDPRLTIPSPTSVRYQHAAIAKMNKDLLSIRNWYFDNQLLLNPDKTKISDIRQQANDC